MVISSSNRTPSPMRSNPNPNSRNNQEREGVGVRKSFSGYPFVKSSIVSQPKSFTPNTPVNSPAEYARRSSFEREFGEHDQKENERDPLSKSAPRVRSPSVSKGCKNFMSPTISAASKINPSPRKKVLGERNEAIRTSASLSDGKFHFFSRSSLEFADENEPKLGLETPPSAPCSTMLDFNNEVSNAEFEKKVSELSPGVGKVESESDLVVLSPEVPFTAAKSSETLPQSEVPKFIAQNNVVFDSKKTIDSSPSLVISPLESDPSYQPYDPKTNFLSPRPQFLHYKPNPRIENYINQGIRLEDDFASESVSETENSEDVQSEETSSSAETSSVEELVPSSELSSSPKSQQPEEIIEASPEETAGDVVEPRSWIGGKWRAAALVLIILLGSISFAMYSPGVGNAIYQDKIMSQVYINSQVAVDVAKESINGLLKSSKVWSAQSVGYLSHLIHQQREVKFSSLPLSNLTVWHEEEVGDYVAQGFELRPSFGRKEVGFETGRGKVSEIERDEFVQHENFADKILLIEPVTDQVVEDSEPEKLEEISVFEDVLTAIAASAQPLMRDEETPESEHKHEEYDIASVTLPLTEEATETSEPEILEATSVLQESVIENVHSAVEMGEQPSLFDEPETQESEQSSLFDEPETQESEQSSLFDEPETQESEQSSLIDEPETQESEQPSLFDEPEIQESELASAVQYESQSDFQVEKDSQVHPQVNTAYDPFSEAVVESSERSLAPIIAAVSVFVVSLLTAVSFMFVKKPKNVTPVVSTPATDHFVKEEKPACMPVASNINSKVHLNSSCSGPVEVDMLGESCPSELSSFHKASSYYNKREQREHDEAQSEEKSSKRNYRRESLASSSSEYTMTSSYGSFTTYSRLPSKNRDDEVVTPVRRSSRIRSKVTSP